MKRIRQFWRPDVSCQEWVELVTAYLDGSLPKRMHRAIDDHLAMCAPCLEYLEQMQRTVDVVGAIGADEAPPGELLDLLEHALDDYDRGDEPHPPRKS